MRIRKPNKYNYPAWAAIETIKLIAIILVLIGLAKMLG
jgi:hypothetical protein